ncbi:hypothetical protein HID58_047061, partial [Brassica napus]
MVVAVKKLKSEGFQGHKEWLNVVHYLGRLHHMNLVKLIGYCLEGEKRLLVYDSDPIPWNTRMKVAISAARGLAFLHEAKVIYRDFKASNILLDVNPCDNSNDGHSRLRAPEYIATGRLTAKSDVYSFGVVLLELLSGRPTVDKTKVGVEQNLVDWAIPYLVDRRKVFRIMDTKLGGRYLHKEACAAANIALRCLNTEAKLRPEMSDVMSTLQQLETSTKKGSTPTGVMSPSPHMSENHMVRDVSTL